MSLPPIHMLNNLSTETIELAKYSIERYKISWDGCFVPGAPLLDVYKLDIILLREVWDVIDCYFTKSGQKGLGLDIVRSQTLKLLITKYVPRGYVYLAFLLSGYELEKERTNNPKIRCKFLTLKNWEEMRTHMAKLSRYMREWKYEVGLQQGKVEGRIAGLSA